MPFLSWRSHNISVYIVFNLKVEKGGGRQKLLEFNKRLSMNRSSEKKKTE